MDYFLRIYGRISLFLILALSVACEPKDKYVVISGYAQGGTYNVKINLNGRDGMIDVPVSEIRDSVDSILSSIDNSLSGYNRKSLLSRFNEGEAIVPDALFLDMYAKAYDIYEATSGVVDAASAPLFDMWGFGFKNEEMPDDRTVRKVMAICGMKRLKRDMPSVISHDGVLLPADLLEEDGQRLPKLNYNAVAQGYSCDLVADYLYGIGVKDMMVDIGEIFCDGVNPSGKQWSIGVDRPVDGNNQLGADLQAIFRVPDGPHGVVTSGNYRKFYIKDGKKYAHTIDPRTGYPVSHNLLSATIVASDAFTADAYATCCMVIGLEESQRFIESMPDVEGCLVYDDLGQFKVWTSAGMSISEL